MQAGTVWPSEFSSQRSSTPCVSVLIRHMAVIALAEPQSCVVGI
jgi:hypothetical protein